MGFPAFHSACCCISRRARASQSCQWGLEGSGKRLSWVLRGFQMWGLGLFELCVCFTMLKSPWKNQAPVLLPCAVARISNLSCQARREEALKSPGCTSKCSGIALAVLFIF